MGFAIVNPFLFPNVFNQRRIVSAVKIFEPHRIHNGGTISDTFSGREVPLGSNYTIGGLERHPNDKNANATSFFERKNLTQARRSEHLLRLVLAKLILNRQR